MRYLPGLIVASAVAVAGIAVATPAWSADSRALACGLGANPPTGSISGTGSRSECTGTVTLTVRVRKDLSLQPDITVATKTQSGFGNGSLTATGSCDGSGNYFTETISSSGNSIQSGRVGRC